VTTGMVKSLGSGASVDDEAFGNGASVDDEAFGNGALVDLLVRALELVELVALGSGASVVLAGLFVLDGWDVEPGFAVLGGAAGVGVVLLAVFTAAVVVEPPLLLLLLLLFWATATAARRPSTRKKVNRSLRPLIVGEGLGTSATGGKEREATETRGDNL
jgi:hypothetical protein